MTESSKPDRMGLYGIRVFRVCGVGVWGFKGLESGVLSFRISGFYGFKGIRVSRVGDVGLSFRVEPKRIEALSARGSVLSEFG